MTIQSKFDLTISLLKENTHSFPIIKDLTDIYASSKIEFFCFDEASRTSPGTTKDNILGAYEIRARIHSESKDSPLIFGYEMLLPGLRVTKHDHICVSSISSNIGGFLVFSDFDRQDLIGLLCTKKTLADGRNWRADYQRKVAIGERAHQSFSDKSLFVNGKYISQLT